MRLFMKTTFGALKPPHIYKQAHPPLNRRPLNIVPDEDYDYDPYEIETPKANPNKDH